MSGGEGVERGKRESVRGREERGKRKRLGFGLMSCERCEGERRRDMAESRHPER